MDVRLYRLLMPFPFSGFILRPKPIMLYVVDKKERWQIVAKKLGKYLHFENEFHPLDEFENEENGKLSPTEVNIFFKENGKYHRGEFVFDDESLAEIKKIDNSKKRDRIFERIWISGLNKFQIPRDMVNLLSTAITVMMIVILIYVIFTNFGNVINPIYDAAVKTAPVIANETMKLPIKVAGG